MNKKVIFATLVIVILGDANTGLAAAAAKKQIYSINKLSVEDTFGPSGFQKSLATTFASMGLMESYADAVRNQIQIDWTHIPSVNNELRDNILLHQKNARLNSMYWLDEIKPKILNTNQNIVNFSDTFQDYYHKLSEGLHQKESLIVKKQIEALYQLILSYKLVVSQLTEQLKGFQDRLGKDTNNFKNDVIKLIPIVDSIIGNNSDLQKKIEYQNEIIKENKKLIWNLIASGNATKQKLNDAKKKISLAEGHIKTLKERLAGVESKLAILIDLKDKTTNMAEITDLAIDTLQTISNQWSTIQAKYNNLLKRIDHFTVADFTSMQADLDLAKKNWEAIKKYIEELQKYEDYK
ncbi:HBL/NHE enterotoxin family protein [Bacillus thuringiensis]|uniref:HBL/NHE enterotoxin family protein n=1 Tax=Bacillus thuringiensis TaxID=1428 RepID=UPI003D01CABA